jgi:peptide/nickel transport system substrate-binding protein
LIGSLAAAGLACAAAGAGASATGATVRAGARRPTLTMATALFPSSLDPAVGINDIFSFEETLTHVDDQGEVTPFLITSLPVRLGVDRWVVNLRPGVTFENGNRVTARIVALADTREEQLSPTTKTILPGARFVATGPLQLTIETSRSTPLLPYLLADPSLSVYDEPVVAAAGGGINAVVGKGVFTAPYAITSYTSGQEMVLKPYNNYWQGRPALSGITVLDVADPDARIAAVESGQVDIADGLNAPQVRQEIRGHGVKLKLSDEPQAQYQLFMNPDDGVTGDVHVRQAIAYALDYEELAKQYTGGVDEPATGILPPNYPLLVKTQVTDVAKAKQILAADGWTAGAAGILQKNGTQLSVSLLIYPQRPLLAPLAIGVQTMLQQVGIQVNINSEPYTSTMYSNPTGWNLAIYHYYAISATGVPDPYYGEIIGTNGALNYWHIADPHLDSLIGLLNRAPTAAKRQADIDALQRYIWQKAYLVDVAFERDGTLVNSDWSNYTPDMGYQQYSWNWQTAPNP